MPTLLGLVLALAVLAVRWVERPEPPAAPVPAPKALRVATPVCPERGDDADAARARALTAARGIATREAGLRSLVGEARDFPDSVPARFGPDGAERDVAAALAGGPASVRYVDCSEYPCIAVVDLPFAAGGDLDEPGMLDTFRRVQDRFGLGRVGTFAADQAGGSFGVVVVPLYAADADAELLRRVDLRQEGIVSDVAFEVAP